MNRTKLIIILLFLVIIAETILLFCIIPHPSHDDAISQSNVGLSEEQNDMSEQSSYLASNSRPFSTLQRSDYVTVTINHYGFPRGVLSTTELSVLHGLLVDVELSGNGSKDYQEMNGIQPCMFTIYFPDGSSANFGTDYDVFALDGLGYKIDPEISAPIKDFWEQTLPNYFSYD